MPVGLLQRWDAKNQQIVNDDLKPDVWTYRPTRFEAVLHICGWSLFAVFVLTMTLGSTNAVVFDLANIPGMGWILCLAVMQVVARRRAGVAWGGFGRKTMRRTWQINYYAILPWHLANSLRVLRSGSA